MGICVSPDLLCCFPQAELGVLQRMNHLLGWTDRKLEPPSEGSPGRGWEGKQPEPSPFMLGDIEAMLRKNRELINQI